MQQQLKNLKFITQGVLELEIENPVLVPATLVETKLETNVMLNQNQTNHEEFSIDYLETVPRSRLYQPPVAGVGTKDIEGLISYIVRVAAAHSVSPWRLLKKIYAVENSDIKAFMYPSFFNKYSSTINGLGKYAEVFVTDTEKLTGSSRLRNTTVLSLANLLPTKGCGLF